MNIKNILIFISGAVVGGSICGLGAREYFSKKYEEHKAALEKYYKKVDEYARVEHEDTEDDSIKEDNCRPGGRMSSEERANIKKKLQKNYEQTTNYATMYRSSSSETDSINDPAESEHPLDDEEKPDMSCSNCSHWSDFYCEIIKERTEVYESCSDWHEIEEDQNEVDEEQAFDDHRKNMNKPPKIISADAYSNLPAHIDQQVLYFYSYDEVLCDENEEMVEDPGLLIGDALTKYDFADSDERCIFVMNYATDTCYEIQKVDASWTDSH